MRNVLEHLSDIDTYIVRFAPEWPIPQITIVDRTILRIGIYELLEIDKEMIDLINKKANAEDIRTAAVKRGMITLLEDGIIKAIQGTTSIEEVLSAAKD